MKISELNILLKPYGIIIECKSCDELSAQAPRPFGDRSNMQSKKIHKKSTKLTPVVFAEPKKLASARKCKTAKKAVKKQIAFLDDSLMCMSAPSGNSPVNLAPKKVDFFFEFKKSCDNFLNCPQFDNLATCDDIKASEFDHETAMSSMELSDGSQSPYFMNLQVLKKDLFSGKNLARSYEDLTAGNDISLSRDCEEGFELDFDHEQACTEFFGFA